MIMLQPFSTLSLLLLTIPYNVMVEAVVDQNACISLTASTSMPDFQSSYVLKSAVNQATSLAALDDFVNSHNDTNTGYLNGFRFDFFVLKSPLVSFSICLPLSPCDPLSLHQL
jgi:hypothetical protein